MTAPVSVCVTAYNEEVLLPRCLEALAWADEIVVVVDAKSCDATEKIAIARAQRVEVREYRGDVEQKRFCIDLASHEWVLVIDSDEILSERLAASLRRALEDPGECAGFELDRVTWHLGRWVRHGDFHPDWKLRLFRRSRARWVGRNPHARVDVEGPVRKLEGELLHYSFRDLSDQIERIQRHTSEAAGVLFAEGGGFRWRDLVLRPPARFLRAYLLKRGFLDGGAGFVIACAIAFSVFLKYAKLWELERQREA